MAQNDTKTNKNIKQNSNKETNSKASQSAKKETNFDADKQSDNQKIKPANAQESTPNNAEKLDDTQNPKDKGPVKHFWWLDAIYFILGTLALGGVATLLGWPMFKFDNYPVPPLMAPDWLFPVAWTIIYIAIGVATFCMWRDKQITAKDRKFNLILYFIHMFFNITWPLLFFRLGLPIVACVWLALVLLFALITTWRYFVANLASGIIFCIYVIWLIYAFYLNIAICLL
jgi:tryptophan-rich sensory protein